MTFIAINLTLIEFIVLPLVVSIFGATLYFFIKSRKSLQETLIASRKPDVVKKEKQQKKNTKAKHKTQQLQKFSSIQESQKG